MLKRFEVENFKGFKDRLVFNLEARDYNYNSQTIRDGLVKNALVYGKNGSGKSSLGIALFDAVAHLTDKKTFHVGYVQAYRNLENPDGQYAHFKYVFQFGKDEVVYEYEKRSYPSDLVWEKLYFNGDLVVDWDFLGRGEKRVNKDLFGSINIDLVDNKLSVVKYLYRNLPTNAVPLLSKLVVFFEKMLWVRCLSDGNDYAGYTNGFAKLTDRIYETGRLGDFQNFLDDYGLHYQLSFQSINGQHELFASFRHDGREQLAQFSLLASTGTNALMLYYYWSITAFGDISFLFIDEFDAFFHFELAASILTKLNQLGFQAILTSHNTYLMSNKLTRPDCCFIITGDKITSLTDATDKEIREAHNLEKMYVNGAFNG